MFLSLTKLTALFVIVVGARIVNGKSGRGLGFEYIFAAYACLYKKTVKLQTSVRCFVRVLRPTSTYEPRHEKTNVLHMRKQRRRSASR